ncbi:MAG: DUF2130 domain-containing protein [Jannaschia helgolandensis]|uniref:DUF2130 domain-containing protein n=1 Tax=Jannaschia helgolandensis TaxID=188906 RepID=A0A1H7R5K2_9RHOB|nr:DUF2130 domain-containing protein [Jannaschia helgolandensis]SEL55409.1 hypothetical protein SAMN04488526_2947 [Jannaschia helgolandensis]
MNDPRITCPACSHEIPLTESLAGPLLVKTRQDAAARQEAALAEQKRTIEAEAAARATAAQAAKLAEIEVRAQEREAEIAAMKVRDADRETKLAAAQKAQAAALAREEALKDREREMDLTIQKQVAAATDVARRKLQAEAEAMATERLKTVQEVNALKLAEKDQQMEGMRRKVEEMQKKMDQGSQQLQGEAAEVVLEDQLARAFPTDVIEPVGKGQRGADCLQRVGTVGTILWEAKRTSGWNKDWLPKLRDDMRSVGADVAVLTSAVRPEGLETFALVDGIWIAAPRYAVPLACVLREGLSRAAEARGVREGQATKTEMLYDYLTGPQFRSRMEAVIEPFEAMQMALLKERKQMQAQWALREKQLEKAMASMMGMYGDVRGIAGAAVAEIEALEPDLLEGD